MKSASIARKPYTGASRSLVIALDVGTTFSGVSYAILEPREIPKIHGVTRFPGQEHIAGNSKIPTILYYDRNGRMMAAGAEAETATTQSLAEDENWTKVELFKLRLRPRSMKLDMNGMRLSRLPHDKTAVHVFGDFLAYLYLCTRNFIKDTHANGAALWSAVEHDIQIILTHPNGWEGAQQTKMRRAAVYGGLIPDTNEGKARIRFVTEGEASLHACILNGLSDDVLAASSKTGFLIADAGGGTLDISSYTILSQEPMEMEEIAPPDCIFAGSVFVSRRAREFLREKLKNSKYGTPDAIDHITKRFDETTKRLFRDKRDPQFIHFGSPLDKDLSVGIRSGQLKLTGSEVAELFEPSIQAAFNAIKAQIDGSSGLIKSVFLVGGYGASSHLFTQLQERLKPFNISVSRPDTQTSKAVADGAIGFYCDHHVSTRMSKFMYGVEYLREYDENNPDHVSRKNRLCELPSGPRLLLDAFDCILARGVKVKESNVFTRKYCTELTSLNTLSVFEVEVWCYRGGNTVPEWIDRNTENFSTLCLVRADLSPLSASAEPKVGVGGKRYWTIVFSVEIHFGLTEFKARIKWVDNGVTKYGPASIIYNERGHRAEEDEPDSGPDDDVLPEPSRCSSTAVSRPHSRPRSAASSHRSSTWGLPKAESIPPSDAESPSSKASSRPETPYTSSRDLQDRGSQRGRSRKEGESSANTRSPSILAETLASVWGAVTSSSPSRKSASHSRSKDVTPLASPKQGSRHPEAAEEAALGTTTPTPEKREIQTVDTSSINLPAEAASMTVESLPAAPEQHLVSPDTIATQSERPPAEITIHTADKDLSLLSLGNGLGTQKASIVALDANGGTVPVDTVQAGLLKPSTSSEPASSPETSDTSAAPVSEVVVQPEASQGSPPHEGSQPTSESAIINEQAARNDDSSGSQTDTALMAQASTNETQLSTVGPVQEKTLQNPQLAPPSPTLSQKPGPGGLESGDSVSLGENQSQVVSTGDAAVSESAKSAGEATPDLEQNKSQEVNFPTVTDKDGTSADNEDSNVGGEAEEDVEKDIEEKEQKQGKKASKKKKKKTGRKQSTASDQATTGDVANAVGRQPSASVATGDETQDKLQSPDPVAGVLPDDGKMGVVSSLSLKLGDANWPRADASLHVITQEA